MIYKSFNLLIVIRILTGLALAVWLGYSLSIGSWDIAVLCVLLLILITWNIVYFVNSINRKVSFFFDAVRNEDTTLHFPENVHDKSLKELHHRFNKVNSLISDIKIRNEHNERFFKEIMEHSATGLLAVDERDYVVLANEPALNFLGLPHISHLHLLKQKNPELSEILEQISPGQSRTVKSLNGSDIKVISLKVKRFQFGENKYRIYSLSDIKTEIEENELDSWQKLIRVMTHEIMNSIAPITSLSNTLRRFFMYNNEPLAARDITQNSIEQTIHGLDVIEQQGKSLLHFVDSYRKLTKIPKPIFKPIHIANWLENIKLLMSNQLKEESVTLSVTVSQPGISLIGDERLLTQVLINLLNNATEALKDKNKKKIEIKATGSEDGSIKITITDNGAGISSDDIEKIFIPFYTTKENGSGIGLSLARQIMRLHKGTITARSVLGKSTTFTMTF
jgi:nitrogen fixation/metabolism regulation signal transduction histidine kinase